MKIGVHAYLDFLDFKEDIDGVIKHASEVVLLQTETDGQNKHQLRNSAVM